MLRCSTTAVPAAADVAVIPRPANNGPSLPELALDRNPRRLVGRTACVDDDDDEKTVNENPTLRGFVYARTTRVEEEDLRSSNGGLDLGINGRLVSASMLKRPEQSRPREKHAYFYREASSMRR